MQVSYIIDLIKPVLYDGVKSLTLKDEVEVKYNKEIQERLGHTVFSKCQSYVRSQLLLNCCADWSA